MAAGIKNGAVVYHIVPKEVETDIRRLGADANTQLIYCCHSSNHPDDAHNYLAVLLDKRTGEYTFYNYNAQTNSFYWGHYNLTFKYAMQLLADKLWDSFNN